MADTRRFPNNGYEVTVVRKQDIIDCLDANVVDKELVLEVISQCEFDASNFIKDGRWTGIPFLGNIRIPKRLQKINSPEIKGLIEEAKQNLDSNRYYIFRRELEKEIQEDIKVDRSYRYIVSSFVNQNKRLYKTLVASFGDSKHAEDYAQFLCYTFTNLTTSPPLEVI